MTNKATDNRPPFFMIEDSVIENYDLNPFEGWLYVVITKHANRKTGESFPSVKTLAKETKMSKASVLRYTKSLETKGLIRVERDDNTPGRDRESNHYWLLTATAPVSDSNRGSFTQTPPPVSESNTNQSQLEPEDISAQKSAVKKPRSKKPTTPKEILNPMADAVIAQFGWKWETASKNEKSKVRGAAKQLCEIGRTPDEVPLFYAECRKRGWKDFSPNALLNVVSDVAKKAATKIIPLTPITDADYPDTADYVNLAGVSNVG